MGQPEWTPATQLERDLADALLRGDGQGYAHQLRSARLLVPAAPAPGAAAEPLLRSLFPPGARYLPVFTSLGSLVWVFGDQYPYEETDLDTLLRDWPGADHHLAVNPGTPVAAFLPPHALTDLEQGRQSLVATADFQRAVADELLALIRRSCLAALAGRPEPSSPDPPGVAAELRDDPPANALEAALRTAVAQADGDAYLDALLAAASVVLPTAAPVADPDQVFDEDFPWRILGGERTPTIAVFSSAAMLERCGAGDLPRIEVEFLNILLSWPGEEAMLYLNPGSLTELALPGDMVLDLAGSLAGSLPDVDYRG